MRGLFGSLTVAIVIATCAAYAAEFQTEETRVGQTLILDFKGNKAAVHGWRLVREDSNGLDLLDVSVLGWILSGDAKPSMFGNPDTMRFRVLAKIHGQADLVFEHNARNMRGHYVFSRKQVRIVIYPPG